MQNSYKLLIVEKQTNKWKKKKRPAGKWLIERLHDGGVWGEGCGGLFLEGLGVALLERGMLCSKCTHRQTAVAV